MKIAAKFLVMLTALVTIFCSREVSAQQVIPPGQMMIGPFPVVCWNWPTILVAQLQDIAINNGQAIILNWPQFQMLPLELQLYIYGHECAHFLVGPDEIAADRWSVCTGKQQGWFPPAAFQTLMVYFQNNPGSIRHPAGRVRVQLMMQAYQNC